MFNALEGDGVIENIYHFLWTKDTIFNSDPSVYIPQTILFKYQKPCYWYFTSVVDNKLNSSSVKLSVLRYVTGIFISLVTSSIIGIYI